MWMKKSAFVAEESKVAKNVIAALVLSYLCCLTICLYSSTRLRYSHAYWLKRITVYFCNSKTQTYQVDILRTQNITRWDISIESFSQCLAQTSSAPWSYTVGSGGSKDAIEIVLLLTTGLAWHTLARWWAGSQFNSFSTSPYRSTKVLGCCSSLQRLSSSCSLNFSV